MDVSKRYYSSYLNIMTHIINAFRKLFSFSKFSYLFSLHKHFLLRFFFVRMAWKDDVQRYAISGKIIKSMISSMVYSAL